jgi:hypothetical protein
VGCFKEGGRVNLAEFNAYLIIRTSPPSSATLRGACLRANVKLESGKDLRVRNIGGRTHTFTEVAQFGAGFVPPLNFGLTQFAPECGAAVPIPAGTRGANVEGLTMGNHNFQCCIPSLDAGRREGRTEGRRRQLAPLRTGRLRLKR